MPPKKLTNRTCARILVDLCLVVIWGSAIGYGLYQLWLYLGGR
jgi:hypothetical protein